MDPRPLALKIVAWLFIAAGVVAAVSMLGLLIFAHRIELNIDLLGLWIGPGLLRLEAKYRTWALRLLIVSFVLAPVAAVLLVLQPSPLAVRIFNRPVGEVSFPVAFAALAVVVGLSVWQFAVLRAPKVRAQFDAQATPPESSATSV